MGFIKGPHPKKSILPIEESIRLALENGFVGQKKINGSRCQIHIVDGKIESLFTRQGSLHTERMEPYLTHAIELAWPDEGRTILEGEWLRTGKQKLFLFDCLMFEGALLRSRTYSERCEFLKERSQTSLILKTLPILTTFRQCMSVICDNSPEVEGLVFKAKDRKGFADCNIIRCRKR